MGTDDRQARSPESGEGADGVEQDIAAEGDEGRRNADAAPPIADDAEKGQTQTPAPGDDVGVPPDEEMGQPDD